MAETTIVRKPRKKRRTGLIVGIILLVLIAGATVAIILNKKGKNGISVEVTEVAQIPIVQTVVATGVIDPETQVKISPEVSGEIVFLGAKEGDRVEKGQVLVRINPQSILAQQEQAREGIAAAEARYSSAKATLLRGQQELARIKQLFDKNLATAQELETAQSQVKIAEAELDAGLHGVEQQRAAYRQVQESVNKTTIVSPISGTVTKLNSKVGEKVVGAIQMSGTEIMTVADLSVIESVVDVSETDVIQVALGDTAEIEVDAIPDVKFTAVVSQIANSPKTSGVGTNEQLTNFEVRVRFIDPDPRLRPGMTATATIRTEYAPMALAVPIQSVTTRSNDKAFGEDSEEKEQTNDDVRNLRLEKQKKEERAQPIVFVRSGDSVIVRPVTTGIRDDQHIEIKSGLSKGEVVVSGSYKAISKDLEQGSKIVVDLKSKSKSSATTEKSK